MSKVSFSPVFQRLFFHWDWIVPDLAFPRGSFRGYFSLNPSRKVGWLCCLLIFSGLACSIGTLSRLSALRQLSVTNYFLILSKMLLSFLLGYDKCKVPQMEKSWLQTTYFKNNYLLTGLFILIQLNFSLKTDLFVYGWDMIL